MASNYKEAKEKLTAHQSMLKKCNNIVAIFLIKNQKLNLSIDSHQNTQKQA